MGFRTTLSNFKKSGHYYEIVHEGDDYVAIWERKTVNERFSLGKSIIHEIQHGPECGILCDVLSVKIRY